jgi:hypothetical protein
MATPVAHESVADYGGRLAVLCYNAELVALSAAVAAASAQLPLRFRQKITLPGSHQPRNSVLHRPGVNTSF